MLEPSPFDADGAHEQAHLMLLDRKDVLDMSTDLGFRVVGLQHPPGHGFDLRLLAMDLGVYYPSHYRDGTSLHVITQK